MTKKKKNNNGIFYVVISLLAVLAIGGVVSAYSGVFSGNNFEGDCVNCTIEAPEEVINPDEVNLGASAGPDMYNDIRIHGTLTTGGGVKASSTVDVATGILTTADIQEYGGMDLTSTGDSTHILTLPATTTMYSFLNDAGDTILWNFRMLGTATKASTTITAGTGIDLVMPEATGADVVIEAGNSATLKFTRESDTDVTVTVTEYIAAD